MGMREVAAAGADCFSKFRQSVAKDKVVSSSSELSEDLSIENPGRVASTDEENAQNRAGTLNSKTGENKTIFQKRTRKNFDGLPSPSGAESFSNTEGWLPNLTNIDVPSLVGLASTSQSYHDSVEGSNCPVEQDSDSNTYRTWQPNFWPSNFCLGNGFIRGRSRINSKWSRRLNPVIPLTYLEGCDVTQKYREPVKMEANDFSSFPASSKSPVMPFFLTDKKQEMSSSSNDFSCTHFEAAKRKLGNLNGIGCSVLETSSSIHQFTMGSSVDVPYKCGRSKSSGNHESRLVSNVRPADRNLNFEGLNDKMFFGFGIAVGVIATIISRSSQVENINVLLHNTQNLVRDLQEELEMKDLLTVKELKNDIDDLEVPFKEDQIPLHVQFSGEVVPDKIYKVKEPISGIEAELEAELERLELNMKASSWESKFSGLSELEVDVVQGELRVNKVDSNKESGGTSDQGTPPANYSVSPMELSIRLHEVVRTRLEEQIAKLELELLDTKKRLHLMEEEKTSSRKDYSNSENESPTVLGSPALTERGIPTLPPDLSDDTLNAYNEALDEFLKMNEDEETNECKLSTGFSGDAPFQVSKDEETAVIEIPDYDEIKIWEHSRDSLEIDESEEEDYEEFGKMLIEQIMEKNRQVSPAVMNARKLLLAMDEQLRLK